MELGMIGLGRMGLNMVKRLLQGGQEVMGYNRTAAKIKEIEQQGARGAYTLADLVAGLSRPRAIWLMLPAGPVIDEHLEQVQDLLEPDDLVIDGGNSFYRDDLRRAAALAPRGIRWLDAGVSGGIYGLEKGYCLMVGGSPEDYQRVEPVLTALAPPEGCLYCGPTGAGHFAKMVHNGIEYGMMQAYAEGFHILEASPYADSFNYARLAHLWNQGSVIRSWLLELAEKVFARDPKLISLRGMVEDSGEGRWTAQQAIDSGVAAPVITLSLMQRFISQDPDLFANRMLAALRQEFGGHKVKTA
jgi:6-phosphogluconate dehydrogenase